MNLKELTTIPYSLTEGLITFALNTSEDGHFCMTARQSAELLRIDYKSVDDTHLRLRNTSFEPSAFVPTKELPCDAKEIYNSANHLCKQELCLDSMLVPDLVQIPLNISIVSIKWAPIGSATPVDSYCACLTNYGGCCVRYRRAGPRNWSPEVVDIAMLWLSYCLTTIDQPPIQTFERLLSIVHDVHITAISWNNIILRNAIGTLLVCISASGKLSFFKIGQFVPLKMPNVALEVVFNLDLFKVNALKWYSFYESGNQQLHSYLCAGDIDGNVTLYEVTFAKESVRHVEKKLSLWSEGDKLRVGEILMEYIEDKKEVLILLCKGPFVLVFTLNVQSWNLLGAEVHDVENMFVSALVKIYSCRYIVTSLGGTIQQLDLTTTPSGIRIEVTNIQCNVNFANYSLHGMCISKNQALWLLALFPRQPIDHLVHRQPVLISICSLPIKNTLKTLLGNPSLQLVNFYDCAELIRFYSIKTGDLTFDEDIEMEGIEENIEVSNQYIYKLKILMIVSHAKAGYYRRKFKIADATAFENQIDLAKRTILAIFYHRQLDTILCSDIADKLTTFQQLSIKSMCRYLANYLEGSFTNDFATVRDTFRPIFESTMTHATMSMDAVPELCVYCNEFLEPDQMECRDGHTMPRCCITMVQVPITNVRHCRQCKTAALDNLEYLRQIYGNGEICCPTCDLTLDMNVAA